MQVNEIEKVSVIHHEFQLLKDRTNGRMILDIEVVSGSKIRTIKYSLPIVSIWVESDSNETVRAFAILGKHSERNLTLLKIIKKFSMLLVYGTSKVISEFDGVVRYGEKPGLTADCEDEDYVRYNIYDCKPKMMFAILDAVSMLRPVGGFEYLNLSVIPDALFLSFGFIKINDYFGNLQPMWKTNISALLDPSDSVYNSSVRNSVKKKGELLLKITQAILEERDIKIVIDEAKKEN